MGSSSRGELQKSNIIRDKNNNKKTKDKYNHQFNISANMSSNINPDNKSIYMLGLSERISNALTKNNIWTIRDFIDNCYNKQDSKLLRLRGLGRKGLLEIKWVITKILNGGYEGIGVEGDSKNIHIIDEKKRKK